MTTKIKSPHEAVLTVEAFCVVSCYFSFTGGVKRVAEKITANWKFLQRVSPSFLGKNFVDHFSMEL